MTVFRDDVLHAFSTLATKLSLMCAVLDDRPVRFQNDFVFMTIRYDDAVSFAVGVEIGERAQGDVIERPFSLEEILRRPEMPAPRCRMGGATSS